jgi:DNA invertase Pin-like site-specific DNA recombinase
VAEKDWPATLQRAAKELERAHEARDRAVREAAAADVSPTAIARAVGLSRMQVYRLIEK